MRIVLRHAPIVLALAIALFLSVTTSAEQNLQTTNPDRKTGCRDVPLDLNIDQVCEFFGFMNWNVSHHQCNGFDGQRHSLYECRFCRPDEDWIPWGSGHACVKQCALSAPERGVPCDPEADETPPSNSCGAGGQGSTVSNPIDHANGSKLLTELDFQGTGPFPLQLTRYYNSMGNRRQRLLNLRVEAAAAGNSLDRYRLARELNMSRIQQMGWPPHAGEYPPNAVPEKIPLGGPDMTFAANLHMQGIPQWRHNYEIRLIEFPDPVGNRQVAMLIQPDGRDVRFFRDSVLEPYESASGLHGALQAASVVGGDGFDGWRRLRSDGYVEEFEAYTGRLLKIVSPSGHTQTLTYATGTYVNGTFQYLERVDDDFGNRLYFSYDAEARLSSVSAQRDVSTGGSENYQTYYTVNYTYAGSPSEGNSRMFETVSYPGAMNARTYHYEDTRFPLALTGVTDENGDRIGTYTYRVSGLAETTQTGTVGNTTTITYTPTHRTVTNPLGKDTIYRYANDGTRQRITEVDGVATASCVGTDTSISYDTAGYKDSTTDARGFVTSYDYNSRGLETRRTEAVGTPEERTTLTEWHPDYALETRIETPLLLTELSYGGDGLLDSRTETDKSSHAAGSRTWTYSYYTTGPETNLLHTIDGPRTDVADITTYEYNDRGLVSRITNALGHQTDITAYDNWGKPASVTDTNGVVTTLTYTSRGWLDTVTVDGTAVTDFDYDETGQLAGVTLPNGVSSSYVYNDAGQLIEISNSLGEEVHFTLDAAGNIMHTSVLASDSTLMFQQQQVFDELSRLRNALGNGGQDYAHNYDLNDNRSVSDDALNNVTSRVFDPLNRLASVTDALTGLVQYAYDAHDNIVSVTDQEGVVTTFQYDGFDNLRQEASPNRGTTTYSYDKADNRTAQTDARGVVANYAYDALSRLTAISYPSDPSLNVSYSYDNTLNGNQGKGRLTGMQDSAGSAVYTYNNLGHMTGKTATIGGVAYAWSMTHDAGGLLSTLSYPGGRVVRYERDAEGRVSAVYTQASGAPEVPVATGLNYNAFGPLAGFQHGNGLQTTLSYDLDYRITGIATAGTGTVYSRSYGHTVTDNIDAIDDVVDASRNQTFTYDPLYRLESASGGYGAIDYQMDGTGNRLGKTRVTGPDSEVETYSYSPGSQRLSDVDSSLNGAPPSTRSFVYDANGNPTTLTTHGGRVLTYTYGAHNRPIAVAEAGTQVASYVYDGLGQRRIKSLPGGTATHFHYADNGQLLAETDHTGALIREYLYGDGMRVAMVVGGSQLVFIHNDHLGTPQVITDAAQQVVWQGDYLPFGEVTPVVSSIDNPIRFPGQYYDDETGTHYNYFRDYDPSTGRYIQSDPIGLRGGPNSYAYVGGRPTRFVDPTGEFAALATLLTPQNVMAAAAGVGALYCLITNCTDGIDPFTQPQLNEESSDEPKQCPTPDNPSWPGDDPTVAPPGTSWNGAPGSKPGDKEGNYHNPDTGESYRPDLGHSEPIGPHWDYHGPNGEKGRFYPDGTYVPK